MRDPFQDLGLEPDASVSDVEEAWRRIRTKLHPDHGGDPSQFHEMRKSYKEALEIAAKPKPCTACDGKGRVKSMKGFVMVSEFCMICGGTGKKK